jgi:hypothetical protein
MSITQDKNTVVLIYTLAPAQPDPSANLYCPRKIKTVLRMREENLLDFPIYASNFAIKGTLHYIGDEIPFGVRYDFTAQRNFEVPMPDPLIPQWIGALDLPSSVRVFIPFRLAPLEYPPSISIRKSLPSFAEETEKKQSLMDSFHYVCLQKPGYTPPPSMQNAMEGLNIFPLSRTG